MRIIFFMAVLASAMVSCKNNDASARINEENVHEITENVSKQNSFPKVEFDRTVHDFGNVGNNEKVETEFEIKNIGDSDLIIINAQASCGCTVPEYQKTPIKPGESSKIMVRFKTSAVGQQQKTVTLTTNTEKGEELLTIKANVAPKDE